MHNSWLSKNYNVLWQGTQTNSSNLEELKNFIQLPITSKVASCDVTNHTYPIMPSSVTNNTAASTPTIIPTTAPVESPSSEVSPVVGGIGVLVGCTDVLVGCTDVVDDCGGGITITTRNNIGIYVHLNMEL